MKTARLGRAAENDMVYAAPAVSARHAELLWDGVALWIRDVGSSNGTFVNGRRISAMTQITAADRVTLGTAAVVDVAAAQALLTGKHDTKTVTIGRAGDNAVIIDNPRVSAHHAVLERRGGTWVLRDLGSSNGTFVNDVRVTEAVSVERGALVRFGQTGPTYVFPDTFGILLEPTGQSQESAGAGKEADATGNLRHSVVLPISSTRTDMWRSPHVWTGLLVLIVMCCLFSYTGNPFAYNSYIYLFGLFACATVLWFIYRLCGKREPWWYMLAPAGFTAVVTVPVLVVLTELVGTASALNKVGFVQRLLEQTFITGLTEELVKILPLLVVALLMRLKIGERRGVAIREPLDGILMASSSAIGFVVLETIFLYCNPRDVRSDYQAWAALQLLIPRIFSSVGGHVAWSGYFGYFIGLGMLRKRQFWLFVAIGYASAALCHGLWNSVTVYGTPFLIMASSVAYLLYMAAILRARLISPSNLRHTVYSHKKSESPQK